jgi:uncharacterized repeat protein (TIGR03803 family)
MATRRFILLLCLLSVLKPALLPAEASPGAPVFSIVLNFDSTHGSHPSGTPIEDSDGNLWGTTEEGGGANQGTVFKLTPDGSLTIIHEFDGADGLYPSHLVLGSGGAFYGTTILGGNSGYGVIFRVKPTGRFSVLHSFSGPDGKVPNSLIRGRDGAYYGTTEAGGTYDGGTIFRITSAGTFAALYNFDPAYSRQPQGLVQDSTGPFYGATGIGGQQPDCHDQCGTVFKFRPNGTLTTIYEFSPSLLDGNGPGELILGSDGWLYGTTRGGGDLNKCKNAGRGGCGTIFRVSKRGKLKTLHAFKNSDGADPNAPLVEGPDGLFYGTTGYTDGQHGDCGAIFSISPTGRYDVLHYLLYPDGCAPDGGLLLHTNGKFYGTANIGGGLNWGDVFSLDLGFGQLSAISLQH